MSTSVTTGEVEVEGVGTFTPEHYREEYEDTKTRKTSKTVKEIKGVNQVIVWFQIRNTLLESPKTGRKSTHSNDIRE